MQQFTVRATLVYLLCLAGGVCTPMTAQIALQPRTMPSVGTVSDRYVSYNVEAVEVTGGRFWKPYAAQAGTAPGDLYQYRKPIDLSNPKLRRLAAGLAPTFMRVSGTWRNSTYFQNDDQPAMETPPAGFKSVMTRPQWKGVVDFAQASGAALITSVAISDGTRDGNGVWTPQQTTDFFNYTRSIGGSIFATEFMNEPSFAAAGAAPKGYDAAGYARDFKVFSKAVREASPNTLLFGPGGIGEGVTLLASMKPPKEISSEDLLKATGPAFDAFSYHFYTTLSSRCVGKATLSSENVLTPAYLDRNPQAEAYYAQLRDQYLPGKQIWLTETGEAGCGGNPWASDFIDTFRFADQLGSLARAGVQSVMVNTLASSDYGLLDEDSYRPRPDYWTALLWKRLMGTRVLDPATKSDATLRIYAHCTAGVPGAVTVLALNLDQKAARKFVVPSAFEQYTLTSPDLLQPTALLNGKELAARDDGSLTVIQGKRMPSGAVTLPAVSVSFLVFHDAKNAACR